jgi:enolase
MASITSIHARSVLDSRGNPTVEVDLTLSDGGFGRAIVPSGASTGAREVLELRDGGTAWLGQGVSKAIANINETIFTALKDKECTQETLDTTMIAMDGTETKSNLGANAILGVSMAFCIATARSNKMPLYKHLGVLTGTTQFKLPYPILNVLNGGAHANWSTDIQEYILFPIKNEPYHEHLRKSVEVFHHLGKLIAKRGLSTNVGNEGGYAPQLSSNQEPFDLLLEAIAAAGYTAGWDGDFMMGIDGAASEFYQNGVYNMKRDKVTRSSDEMVGWLVDMTKKYPIYSIEDGLAEEDWDAWAKLVSAVDPRIQIVGDDLTVTNPKYVQKGIDGKNCNAIIVKVNQIGSLTETFAAMKLAKAAGWKTISSHRSGETEDVFISHLAVGAGADQIKTGAPSRGERTAKYNELLRIEEELQ